MDGFGANARRYVRFAAIACLIVLTLTPASRGFTSGGADAGSIALSSPGIPLRAANTVVVRARTPAALDRVAAEATERGFTVSQRVPALSALRLVPPAGVSVDAAITRLDGADGVAYAEPAYTMLRADAPADPLFAREAAYLDIERAPEAWNIETGKPSVLVAVLDTGVDVTHPDLQGRIWTNPAGGTNSSPDFGGSGCVDDLHGCAFVGDPSPGCPVALNGNISDDLGHGTFVSGIIAASGNDAGMVGVARGVTILPVKVLDCKGNGDTLSVAAGIIYAAKAGARVINISLGGPADSAILREAVRIAHDRYGILIVAASGNTGANSVEYPARYPNVLAVGAASSANPDQRAPFSATGPEISVVAIGEGIVGTVPRASCGIFLPCLPEGPYAIGDGTSFAAPQVTGLVALMLSYTPALTPDAVLNIIKATADPVPAGARPDWAGAGRIDMFAALQLRFRIGAPGVTKN